MNYMRNLTSDEVMDYLSTAPRQDSEGGNHINVVNKTQRTLQILAEALALVDILDHDFILPPGERYD